MTVIIGPRSLIDMKSISSLLPSELLPAQPPLLDTFTISILTPHLSSSSRCVTPSIGRSSPVALVADAECGPTAEFSKSILSSAAVSPSSERGYEAQQSNIGQDKCKTRIAETNSVNNDRTRMSPITMMEDPSSTARIRHQQGHNVGNKLGTGHGNEAEEGAMQNYSYIGTTTSASGQGAPSIIVVESSPISNNISAQSSSVPPHTFSHTSTGGVYGDEKNNDDIVNIDDSWHQEEDRKIDRS